MTRNRMGWASTVLNPAAKRFAAACGDGSRVLDIGAAYGTASLAALGRGAVVLANDLDERHLQDLWLRTPEDRRARLRLLPGRFPGGLGENPGPLDAVLASNVFHFLNGRQIRLGLGDIHGWLRPGGRLFVQAATPYQAPFAAFLPEYERRVAEAAEWPGWIAKLSEYCRHRQIGQMPRAIHLLDLPVLERECAAAGFAVEWALLHTRPDLPESLRLDGRESLGLVAVKSGC